MSFGTINPCQCKRGRFGQVIGHHHAYAVALGHPDRRTRHLLVDGIGHHLHIGQNAPFDDGKIEIEDFHPVFDARFQHLRTASVEGRGIGDIARIDCRHVFHRIGGHIAGHDHTGGHDRPIDIVRTNAQVGVHRRPDQPSHQRQYRQHRNRHQLWTGDTRFHFVHAAVGFHRRRSSIFVMAHLVLGMFHGSLLRPCARRGRAWPCRRDRRYRPVRGRSSIHASVPCSPATSSSDRR